jgi:hypothetical protein
MSRIERAVSRSSPLLQRRTLVLFQNGVDYARPAPRFEPLAKLLEDRAQRELTETALIVVAARGQGTESTF